MHKEDDKSDTYGWVTEEGHALLDEERDVEWTGLPSEDKLRELL